MRSHGPIQRGQRENTGAHRIVSRFIAPMVWNNESTEMSNLLALSVHDERRDRDVVIGTQARYNDTKRGSGTSNPLTERNFPPLCIFLWPVFLSRPHKRIS